MTIEKRGKSFRATAYKSGQRHRKTFRTKQQAMAWIVAMRQADDVVKVEAKGKTFRDLLALYRDTVTPQKKSHEHEHYKISAIMRESLADKLLTNLALCDFEDYFNRRRSVPSKQTGRPILNSSLIREKNVISAVLAYGIKIGWLDKSPLNGYKPPPEPPHRERIASPDEMAKLLAVVGWDGESAPVTLKQRVTAAFVFSTLTGMRLGEIVNTRREWIDGRVIHLPAGRTKTDTARDVALSKKARALLDLILSLNIPETVFGLKVRTGTHYFVEIRNAAGLGPVRDADGYLVKEGLNFHDGRATFATWAASHLTPLALARQLGHKDLKMTMRYYRSRPEQVAALLDKG